MKVPTVETSIRMPLDLLERYRQVAAARGVGYTALMREVLEIHAPAPPDAPAAVAPAPE